jgi:hypothetical protein
MAGVKVQIIIHAQVVNFDGGPADATGGVTRAVGRCRAASSTARTLDPELRGVSLDLACEADALARHGIAGAAVAQARQGRERMPVPAQATLMVAAHTPSLPSKAPRALSAGAARVRPGAGHAARLIAGAWPTRRHWTQIDDRQRLAPAKGFTMFPTSSARSLAAGMAVASLALLAACQRNEAPTPGVAGGSANAPAAASSEPATTPATGDAQVGAGKSPGAARSAGEGVPQGVSGNGGTAPAPSSAANPDAPGLPVIPPAQAPGTAAPSQPASAPGS